MKMNLRHKAKSALSILLTLCMVLSVLTVGIASFGAAEVDVADVGWSDLTTVIFDNSKTNWSNVYLYICETGYVRSYQMTASDNSSVFVKTDLGQWSSRQNMFFASVGNYNSGSNYNNANTASLATLANGGSYTARISASNSDAKHIFYPANGSNGAALSKADAYVVASGTDSGQSYSQITATSWSTTADIMNYDGTNYTRTYENKAAATYSLDVVKYDDWNTKCITAGTMTECTSSTVNNNMTITTTNLSDIAVSFASNKINVTATVKKIAAPTNVKINNVTSSSVNASSSTSSSLTWTAVSGAGSYEIYNGTTKVGTSTTNSYSITNTVDNAGTYSVKAVPSDSGYLTSDSSSSVTLTVYEPAYCITGNHVGWDAFLIDSDNDGQYDDEPAKTTPVEPANWFNTWQDSLAINKTTGTAGVYSFTFKVKERADYNYDANICIYLKDVGQKAFIYNDTAHNTSGNDITVPDEGISSGLYAYDLAATTPGGSLKLKNGQTYTITIDQTQRYDSSSPYGKITITTTDAYVEPVAKQQSYDSTNRQYASVADAAATIGTVSAEPTHGPKTSTLNSTLTATVVNNDYDFIGWYSDAACTTQVIAASACTKSGNSYTTEVSVDATTYYYALFKQKQPTDYAVAITQPDGGTIAFTGGVANTALTSTTAYAGATVGLSLNITDHGKEFASWKIVSNTTGADVTSSVLNSAATATSASFSMPPYPVTVTANLRAKTPVSITVTSSNTSLGTASYTEGTYYVGDSIPVSATNAGGVFSRWVVTGGTVTNANSASTTVTATGSTVTIRAVFDYKTYQLFSDKDTAGNTTSAMYTLVRQDDGTYVSTRTVDTRTGSFTIYDVAEAKYAVPGNSDFEFNTGYLSRNNSSWSSSSSTYKYKIKSGLSGEYYVVFNPSTGSYGNVSVTTTNPMGTIAQIYAKDGSIRYANGGTSSGGGASSGDLWEKDNGGPTANRGVTVISKINGSAVANPDTKRYPSTNQSEHLKIYSAAMGSTITIETTVNSTYQTQGFYVGMFVVNGWKVAATDIGNGKYTATYTLDSEYSVNNLAGDASFEITPVYYNKNFDYITFYVDALSVPSEWKGTISACATYANTSGTSATNAHFEGTYPGQPLGREGDLYELKVAKYYYSYSGGKWSAQENYYPAATITAYNYDSVHHYYYVYADENVNTENNKNYQTYDYADFSYLAQIDKIEAILFRCMKETSKANRTYCGVSATRPADSNVNTYKLLTDYYGNPIDALGNKLTGDALTNALSSSPTAEIKIVSCGNISNDNKKSDNSQDVAYKNWRTKGNWITAWKVFKADTTATHIAVGSPADFVNTKANTTDTPVYNFSYASGKSSSDLANKVTFISYEKELDNDGSLSGDGGNTGKRIDGQWYYSAQHEFDSNVKVAITTSTTGSGVTTSNTDIETDTNSANNTGYIGGTSGTKATLDGETTHTYNNVTTEAELKSTVGSGYMFVGWYIYDGSSYIKIHDNFADQNTTMTMKKNYTIIAVVREVPSGSLVITHTRYTGSNPDAHDGTGKYYVSAVITHSGGSTTTIAEAQNSIAVPGLLSTDKITITLRTVCDGADTFYAWYEEALGDNYSRTGNYYEICDENVDPMGESQVSYTFFAADCSTFFSGGSLARKTLDFYSDIVHVSAYATLTYKYYDRFSTAGNNQMVSYTVKNVPLSLDEINAGYIPTDEKIATYAPNVVDTIYTDTKWTIVGTKVERAASNVTLMATQSAKDCYVLYLPEGNVAHDLLQSTSTETAVDSIVTWNSRIVSYNSWLINDNADLSAPDESDFYVTAPESYTYESGGDSTTWNFVRYDVYSYNRKTGTIGNVIYSSNDKTFGYRIYADCVLYPVYQSGDVTKELTAKVEPAVLNREVYGDSASPVDKLYADLLISFINASVVGEGTIPSAIKDNDPAESGYKVETGVILEKAVTLSDSDFNTLKEAAAAGNADTTSTILDGYSASVSTADVTALANGSKTTVTGLTKYTTNLEDLTNKNRADVVFRYTNTEAAQKRVFVAYSYIVIRKNSDNSVVTTAISNAQKFNFAYIGNKPLITVS